MRKVAIIGVSCSGKSTFAYELSKNLNLNFTDLDDLFWNPGWIITESNVFLEKVKTVLESEEWIIAGNYQTVQKVILKEADTIIWLDYSRFVVWKRALLRTFKRALLKEPCCNGNFESLKLSFFSKDSILLWVYQDYPRKKKRYEEMLSRNYFRGKDFKRIYHPHEAVQFLKDVRFKTRLL